jgi:DNA-binding NtrC family response regulator
MALPSSLGEAVNSSNFVGQGLTSVLLVDSDPDMLDFLQQGLKPHFSMIKSVRDAGTADALLARMHFDLIIVDVRLPGESGLEWVVNLREQGFTTPVIFTAAQADRQITIDALRAGAVDFILKPFQLERVQASVERCMQRHRIQNGNSALQRQASPYFAGHGIVGSSEPIKSLCQIIERIAPTPSTVLIHGESGTGKELAARAIHQHSQRRGSFVPLNCGAMNVELLESELFGHAKGAFTGALKSHEGLFSYADGGTLFLDEIGEMPLTMQTRLLRVLEEGNVRPVGDNREVPVDVRVITATNRDLQEEVAKGRFREDLFYRLSVLSLRMPPLREHLQDLPELVHYFVTTLAQKLDVDPPVVGPVEIEQLSRYAWPGNVRELRNVIERCLLLNHQPSQCLTALESNATKHNEKASCASLQEDLCLETVERQHILRVLDMQQGNKSAAARILGVSRKTLERKCQRWGMH